jgi:putative addiction module component (TIGR02574 family)
MSVAQVRELALGLSIEDRALLARELIESLEPGPPDPDVEAAWLDEIESRAEALERGEATADDWKASLDRVRQQLREGRKP